MKMSLKGKRKEKRYRHQLFHLKKTVINIFLFLFVVVVVVVDIVFVFQASQKHEGGFDLGEGCGVDLRVHPLSQTR